jgi:hypothetical protein
MVVRKQKSATSLTVDPVKTTFNPNVPRVFGSDAACEGVAVDDEVT